MNFDSHPRTNRLSRASSFGGSELSIWSGIRGGTLNPKPLNPKTLNPKPKGFGEVLALRIPAHAKHGGLQRRYEKSRGTIDPRVPLKGTIRAPLRDL